MPGSNYLLTAALFACMMTGGVATAGAQSAAPMSSDISYAVAMSQPHTHLLEVEISIKVAANLQTPNESDFGDAGLDAGFVSGA